MARGYAIYMCGFDDEPAGPRGTDCPDPLHDYPLPSGFIGAMVQAERRLETGWLNVGCPRCGEWGWLPPRKVHPYHPGFLPRARWFHPNSPYPLSNSLGNEPLKWWDPLDR